MQRKQPIILDDRIHMIDGFDLGMPERTGIYVINEDALTLIESGASSAVTHVEEGLEALGYSLADVKYIIVTHIHLDHAGGAGLLLQKCPNAKVVVHPRGARHLMNPEKLIAGAKAVYKEKFDDFFAPVIPIAEEKLIVKGEGETLTIGENCELLFMDTPGHANHHFSIYDSISKGVFTGDTTGIRYESLVQEGVELFLPTTSPNQFNPKAMKEAIERLLKMNIDRIYFGHYGATNQPKEALREIAYWLDIFIEIGEQSHELGESYEKLAEKLLNRVQEHLRTLNIADDHSIYDILKLDATVCAMGIIDYYSKIKK